MNCHLEAPLGAKLILLSPINGRSERMAQIDSINIASLRDSSQRLASAITRKERSLRICARRFLLMAASLELVSIIAGICAKLSIFFPTASCKGTSIRLCSYAREMSCGAILITIWHRLQSFRAQDGFAV